MLVLLLNLGLQFSRPGSSGSGQQMCTIWKRRKPITRSCRNKPRGPRMRVWRRESGLGAGEGGPLPSNPLSRNPWRWDRTAVVGLGVASGLGACPGPPAKRTWCSQVRWLPPSWAGRLPNRCLSNLPAPHSPAASPRPLPPL